MKVKSERIKRYSFQNSFNHYTFYHYIDTSVVLNESQQQSLKKLLAAFPHCKHDNDWKKRFLLIDFNEYDSDLLVLAANAHDGRNPVLHTVSDCNGPIPILQKLIDLGARIDALDQMNKLAMHWAITNIILFCDQNNPEGLLALKCLLENGARADISCYEGKTPLEYALSRGYLVQAELIKPYEKIQKTCFVTEAVTAVFQKKIPLETCREISRYLFWNDAKNLAQTSSTTWEHVDGKIKNMRQIIKKEVEEVNQSDLGVCK